MVGMREAGIILGVSRQRAHQLAARYSDWPRPVAVLGGRRYWHRRSIEAWLRLHPDRPGGRPRGRREG